MIKWMGQKNSFNFTMSDDSCIQCNSIVRMIGIFSGTDMIKKSLICTTCVHVCLFDIFVSVLGQGYGV